MGDWQEISGFVRGRQRHLQDSFWTELQRTVGRLDIRDGERLCAVALVKRLFPKLGATRQERAIGWRLGAANWPSTAYMAAVPWLMHAGAKAERRSKLRRIRPRDRTARGARHVRATERRARHSSARPGSARRGCRPGRQPVPRSGVGEPPCHAADTSVERRQHEPGRSRRGDARTIARRAANTWPSGRRLREAVLRTAVDGW